MGHSIMSIRDGGTMSCDMSISCTGLSIMSTCSVGYSIMSNCSVEEKKLYLPGMGLGRRIGIYYSSFAPVKIYMLSHFSPVFVSLYY
jgi:hypothetical protein